MRVNEDVISKGEQRKVKKMWEKEREANVAGKQEENHGLCLKKQSEIEREQENQERVVFS